MITAVLLDRADARQTQPSSFGSSVMKGDTEGEGVAEEGGYLTKVIQTANKVTPAKTFSANSAI